MLSALTYPDGRIVTASPDALGRPTAVATGTDLYATNVTYYRNGAMSGFRYGGLSTVTHTMTQNARGLPSRSQDVKTGSGAWTILDDTYVYDVNGNVASITDAAQNFKRTMGYDGLDRLTSAVSDNLATPTPTNDGPFGAAAYAYDPLDNLRSADQGTRLFRYDYDANWRLATIKNPGGTTLYSFTHDARGNQLTKNTQDFVFDAANRMSSAEVTAGTGGQVYRYDGLGRRVQATDPNGTTTYWAYSRAGQVLYSSEGRRSRNIAYIYLGNTQVATRTQAWAPLNTVAIRYQYTDALGSPVVDTDSAVASASVTRATYAPYGEALAPAVVDGTGYTGHVMDAGTGLTYMQQRYYDPVVGQFISRDPIPTQSRTGSNFSPYWYASNNPYRFVDPDGRFSCTSGPQDAPCSIGEAERVARGMADIRAATNTYRPGSVEHRLLSRILNFYGKPGEKNGVKVRVDSSMSRSGGAVRENGYTVIKVNPTASHSVSHGNAAVERADFAGTLVHEGDHGYEALRFGSTWDATRENWSEKRAGAVEALLFQGLGVDAPSRIWTTTGGIDPVEIERQADASTASFLCAKRGTQC